MSLSAIYLDNENFVSIFYNGVCYVRTGNTGGWEELTVSDGYTDCVDCKTTNFPSPTPSITPTVSPSTTLGYEYVLCPSVTPSISITPTISVTPTPTSSISVTPSVTPSITPTISITPSVTISVTPRPTTSTTPTISVTNSVTPTISITPTISVTPSVTPSVTNSITPSITPSTTTSPSYSVTPSISTSIGATVTPSPTVTVTPTISVTPSITPSITPTASISTTPGASITPSPSPSVSDIYQYWVNVYAANCCTPEDIENLDNSNTIATLGTNNPNWDTSEDPSYQTAYGAIGGMGADQDACFYKLEDHTVNNTDWINAVNTGYWQTYNGFVTNAILSHTGGKTLYMTCLECEEGEGISCSVTPSVTPSITITPSITVTPSISITPSITVTPETSISTSASISVTPSISITPSISVTPSKTPPITPSITPSVSDFYDYWVQTYISNCCQPLDTDELDINNTIVMYGTNNPNVYTINGGSDNNSQYYGALGVGSGDDGCYTGISREYTDYNTISDIESSGLYNTPYGFYAYAVRWDNSSLQGYLDCDVCFTGQGIICSPSPSITPSITVSISLTPSISHTPPISPTPSISISPTPSVSTSAPSDDCTAPYCVSIAQTGDMISGINYELDTDKKSYNACAEHEKSAPSTSVYSFFWDTSYSNAGFWFVRVRCKRTDIFGRDVIRNITYKKNVVDTTGCHPTGTYTKQTIRLTPDGSGDTFGPATLEVTESSFCPICCATYELVVQKSATYHDPIFDSIIGYYDIDPANMFVNDAPVYSTNWNLNNQGYAAAGTIDILFVVPRKDDVSDHTVNFYPHPYAGRFGVPADRELERFTTNVVEGWVFLEADGAGGYKSEDWTEPLYDPDTGDLVLNFTYQKIKIKHNIPTDHTHSTCLKLENLAPTGYPNDDSAPWPRFGRRGLDGKLYNQPWWLVDTSTAELTTEPDYDIF